MFHHNAGRVAIQGFDARGLTFFSELGQLISFINDRLIMTAVYIYSKWRWVLPPNSKEFFWKFHKYPGHVVVHNFENNAGLVMLLDISLKYAIRGYILYSLSKQ